MSPLAYVLLVVAVVFGAVTAFVLVQGRPLMCSGCAQVVRRRSAFVLPSWNESAPPLGNYVTTFRCRECLPETLRQARARVEVWMNGEHECFCSFLDRYGWAPVAARMRRVGVEASRPIALQLLADIEARKARFRA